MRLRRIVSGGQTGVDRAALRVGLLRGLEIGGYVPAGYLAEDGSIPEPFRSNMTPLESSDYSERTRRNVVESEATLVLVGSNRSPGTELTIRECQAHGRPYLVVPATAEGAGRIKAWIAETDPAVVNVAGPRESEEPGIGDAAFATLMAAL